MKLTILGNNGPFPGPGGACSGYLLRSGSTKVMIDCGNGTLANLQKIIRSEDLDAIILTHLHSDHTSDMQVLKYAIQIKRNRGIIDKLLKVYAPAEPAAEFERINAKDAFVLEAISNETRLVIGDMEISFAGMKHPYMDYAVSVKCDGKKFVFSGDTSWTDDLIGFAKGADLLMLDAGLLEKDYTDVAPHMTASQCARAASLAGAGKLLLTHLWPDYDPKDLLREAHAEFSNTEVAELMKEYEI